MIKIIKQSNCTDFVADLPQGLDTPIGEQGVRLSGGQRQRLALARALYAQPSILILDEPTSALDPTSEKAIQKALRNLHGRLTILTIAHRLSTIRNSDTIFVLDKGRVVAQGSHEELLARGGIYRHFYETQISDI